MVSEWDVNNLTYEVLKTHFSDNESFGNFGKLGEGENFSTLLQILLAQRSLTHKFFHNLANRLDLTDHSIADFWVELCHFNPDRNNDDIDELANLVRVGLWDLNYHPEPKIPLRIGATWNTPKLEKVKDPFDYIQDYKFNGFMSTYFHETCMQLAMRHNLWEQLDMVRSITKAISSGVMKSVITPRIDGTNIELYRSDIEQLFGQQSVRIATHYMMAEYLEQEEKWFITGINHSVNPVGFYFNIWKGGFIPRDIWYDKSLAPKDKISGREFVVQRF